MRHDIFAKEPPDIEHQSLRQHLSCLFEKDGWYFNLIYIITFGGFIGLATFLPSFYYAQFHVSKIVAGELTVLATLTGSATRVLGGWFSDRVGGITTLSVVFLITIAGLFGLMTTPPLFATTLLFMLCFAALGAGNGATFQLVPIRWPLTTAVAGGMIGEIGALGGSILPNLLGLSKQYTSVVSSWFCSLRGAGDGRSHHAPCCFKELDDDLGRSRGPSPDAERFFFGFNGCGLNAERKGIPRLATHFCLC